MNGDQMPTNQEVPPFWQNSGFRIDRYMDQFHRLTASNEEIQTIEEKCLREHFDPAEEERRRSLRHAHVPGSPSSFA